MRNLKKVLSLALALVMLLGMMVVGAGAAETKFPDDSKIENKEAVAVANAIGVLLGDEKGNFNPDGTLNRAQAAVVIAKLDLGGSASGALTATGASKFIDVGPSFSWAQAYIDYCAGRELIVGDGTGKFLPGKNVTGVEFALMVCRVLGYNSKAENLSGADWALKGAALAQKAGLTHGVAASTTDMTRDQMAQMVLNALVADTVEYPNGTGTDVSINGANVTIGAGKAAPKKHVSSTIDKIDSTYDQNKVSDLYNWKLCEEKYPDLKIRSDVDAFGRPTSVWSYGRKDVFEKNLSAHAEYTKATTASAIAKALNVKAAKVDAVVITDGKEAAAVKLSALDKLGGNGTLTQAWYDEDTDEVTITVIHTYVAKVGSVNKAGDTITLNPLGSSKPASLKNTVEKSGFATEDVVSYTAAWDGKTYAIQDVTALEPDVTGTLTSYTGKNNTNDAKAFFAVDKEKYDYSDKDGISADIAVTLKVGSTVNVYRDAYEYVLYAEEVVGATNYAVVIGLGSENTHGNETKGATLLLADGTIEAVTLVKGVTKLSEYNTPNGNLVNDLLGDLVTYTVNDKGEYQLNSVKKYEEADTTGKTPTNAALNGKQVKFTNGKSAFTFDGGSKYYYATSETLFFVATGEDTKLTSSSYKVYKGYSEMPSLTTDGINGYAAVITTNNQITAIYLAAGRVQTESTAKTFVLKQKAHQVTTTSDGDVYYQMPAIVDGEITTLKLDYEATLKERFVDVAKGNATLVTQDSFKAMEGILCLEDVVMEGDIITNATIVKSRAHTDANIKNDVTYMNDVGTRAKVGVTLGIGNNNMWWAYTDDTNVFTVDKDLTAFSESSVDGVGKDENDDVYFTVNSSKKTLADVIIWEKAENDNNNNNANAAVIDGAKAAISGNDTLSTNPASPSTIQIGYVGAANKPKNVNDIQAIVEDWAKNIGKVTLGDRTVATGGYDWACKDEYGTIQGYIRLNTGTTGIFEGIRVHFVNAAGTDADAGLNSDNGWEIIKSETDKYGLKDEGMYINSNGKYAAARPSGSTSWTKYSETKGSSSNAFTSEANKKAAVLVTGHDWDVCIDVGSAKVKIDDDTYYGVASSTTVASLIPNIKGSSIKQITDADVETYQAKTQTITDGYKYETGYIKITDVVTSKLKDATTESEGKVTFASNVAYVPVNKEVTVSFNGTLTGESYQASDASSALAAPTDWADANTKMVFTVKEADVNVNGVKKITLKNEVKNAEAGAFKVTWTYDNKDANGGTIYVPVSGTSGEKIKATVEFLKDYNDSDFTSKEDKIAGGTGATPGCMTGEGTVSGTDVKVAAATTQKGVKYIFTYTEAEAITGNGTDATLEIVLTEVN